MKTEVDGEVEDESGGEVGGEVGDKKSLNKPNRICSKTCLPNESFNIYPGKEDTVPYVFSEVD